MRSTCALLEHDESRAYEHSVMPNTHLNNRSLFLVQNDEWKLGTPSDWGKCWCLTAVSPSPLLLLLSASNAQQTLHSQCAWSAGVC